MEEYRGSEVGNRFPSILLRVYPGRPLFNLRDLLLRLASTSSLAASLEASLVQPLDHGEYVHGVLGSTWCIVNPGAPALVDGFSLAQSSTQEQLLRLAVGRLLQDPGTRANVLCVGGDPKAPGRFVLNSVSAGLMTPPWQLLLSRIGDTLMIYLLLHCSLFSRLGNGTVLQLAGMPMTHAARAVQFAVRAGLERDSGGNTRTRPPKRRTVGPQPATLHSKAVALNGPAEGPWEGGVAPGPKPARFSSWKRRKLAAQRAEAAGALDLGMDIPATQEIEVDPDTLPPTQTLDPPGPDPPPLGRACAGGPPAFSVHPKPPAPLSSLALPRSMLFYSATFSQRAGFLTSHILRQLTRKRGKGRILFSAIFEGAVLLGPGRACNSLPRARVPKSQVGTVKLLSKLAPAGSSGSLPVAPTSIRAACAARMDAAMDEVHATLCGMPHSEAPPTGTKPCSSRRLTPPASATTPATVRRAAADFRNSPASSVSPFLSAGSSMVPPTPESPAAPLTSHLLPLPVPRVEPTLCMSGMDPALCMPCPPPRVPGPSAPSAGEGYCGVDPSPPTPPTLGGASGVPPPGALPLTMGAACASHARVAAFVWACLRRCVPAAMLGRGSAPRVLRATLRRFVGLRRFEGMTVHDALQGLRLKDLPWLGPTRPASAAVTAGKRLARWVTWLFTFMVIPLLRGHFYATESDGARLHVSYFRKPVWVALRRAALDNLEHTQYQAIPRRQAMETLRLRTLGVARLRLLPKKSGVRVITNLGRPSVVGFSAPPRARSGMDKKGRVVLRFRSVNETLKDVFQILRYEVARQPSCLGGSVMGMNDTYCRLQPVLRRWRAACGAEGGAPGPGSEPGAGRRAYVATMDVARAFDSMDADTTLSIVAPLLGSPRYTILQYTEVMPTPGGNLQVRLRRRALPEGTAGVTWPATARATAAAVRGQAGVAATRPPPGGHPWASVGVGRVVQGGAAATSMSRDSALRLLGQHLRANLVRLRRRWQRQVRGVSQGSTLSTLLCCLYLARAEAAALASAAAAGAAAAQEATLPLAPTLLPQPHAPPLLAPRPMLLLLRQVDDFLLVSGSEAAARAFLARMTRGFPELGLGVNTQKTRASWGGEGAPPASRLLTSRCGATFLPWCGLLLNVATLQVQGDYSRYHGDQVRWSFVVSGAPRRGGHRPRRAAALPSKIVGFLRPKAHPLLLDARLNGPDVVALNVYQTLCLAAMKVHCYAATLPAPPGVRLLVRTLEEGVAYMMKAARPRRVVPVFPTVPPVKCRSRLAPAHIRFLALVAFERVLGRKQSTYTEFLAWIRTQLESPALGSMAALLAPVVKPERSSILDAILY